MPRQPLHPFGEGRLVHIGRRHQREHQQHSRVGVAGSPEVLSERILGVIGVPYEHRENGRMGTVLPFLTRLGVIRLFNVLPAHPDFSKRAQGTAEPKDEYFENPLTGFVA